MRKILTAIGASGFLVAGALMAVAVLGTVAIAQEDTTGETPTLTRHHALLDDALAELVAEGVIDQDAADAVTERVQQKAEERMAEFGDGLRHGRHHGFGRGGLVGPGFLDDGVVDADELAQLPEDHPFRDADGPFAEYLDDGQLTTDEIKDALTELRESGEGGLFEFRRRSLHRFGPFGTDTPPEDAEISNV